MGNSLVTTLIMAVLGGIIAQELYVGALHIPPVAGAMLGLPGGFVATAAGRIVHTGSPARPGLQALLAYSIFGTLLLMGAADAALRLAS